MYYHLYLQLDFLLHVFITHELDLVFLTILSLICCSEGFRNAVVILKQGLSHSSVPVLQGHSGRWSEKDCS